VLLSSPDLIPIGGAALAGAAFGVTVQRSRFCLLAAVANARLFGDWRQLGAFLAALGVAVALSQALAAAGVVNLAESSYRASPLDWAGALAGGTVFGVGTVLAGGCAGRTLVGAAEGNGGYLVALVTFALGAWMAAYGWLEPARLALIRATAAPLADGDAGVPAILGVPPLIVAIPVALAALLAAAAIARRAGSQALACAGAVVGVLAALGWWASVSRDEFAAARPDSLSFSGGLARIVLLLGGKQLGSGGFGVALVLGAIAGAAASALASRTWRWILPPPGQMLRSAAGGLLMGVGAAFAGGCNIGHGITGLSALSFKSVLVVVAIGAGILPTLAWFERRALD
jgi:uncharacterized membrane protein YedE/YeeE